MSLTHLLISFGIHFLRHVDIVVQVINWYVVQVVSCCLLILWINNEQLKTIN